MTVRRVFFSTLCAFALGTSSATACFMELGLNGGLSVSHPSSIPVLVATRTAIEKEKLPRLGQAAVGDDDAMLVYSVYRYLAMHADRSRLSGPAYKALFLGTALWVEVNSGCGEACFHAKPAQPGETSIVIADAAMAALFAGTMAFDEATQAGLVAAHGPEGDAALAHFGETIASFAETNLGKRAGEMVGLMMLRLL